MMSLEFKPCLNLDKTGNCQFKEILAYLFNGTTENPFSKVVFCHCWYYYHADHLINRLPFDVWRCQSVVLITSYGLVFLCLPLSLPLQFGMQKYSMGEKYLILFLPPFIHYNLVILFGIRIVQLYVILSKNNRDVCLYRSLFTFFLTGSRIGSVTK